MANDLVLRIGADLSALSESLKRVENRLKRFSFRAERVGRELTTRLTLPIAAVGVASVRTFAQFDRLEKGLSAIAGSADEGKRQFASLLDVVKDTRTTLDLRTAATASLQLQAVGRSAADTENTLRQLAIAATLSGGSADDVGEVGRQLAQAAAKGSILQQELRIILERIPALAGVIKNEFGVVTAEGLRDAGVSADEFINRLTTAIEQNQTFQNVQGGLTKSIETFGIELQIAAGALGETIANTLNLEENLKRLSAGIARVVQGFRDLNPATQRAIVFTAGLAAAVGPLSLGIGALARSVPLLRSGFALLLGPVGSVGKLFVGLTSTLGVVGKALTTSWGRAVLLGKGLSALRAAFAVLTGPIGLAVTVITTLTAAVIRGYRNSETFREQISLVIDPIVRLAQAIGNLLVRAFKFLGVNVESVGNLFSGFITFVAGSISAVIELFRVVFAQLSAIGSEIGTFFSDLFSGNFSGARDSARRLGALLGEDLSASVKEKFRATVQEINFGRSEGDAADTPDVGALPATAAAATTSEGGGGGVIRQTAEAVALLNTELNANQLAAAQANVAGLSLKASNEALQETIGGLSINTSNINGVFDRLRERYAIITEQNLAFGDSFNAVGERITAVRSAITELTEQGFSAASLQVRTLTEELGRLTEAQTANAEAQQAQQDKIAATVSVIGSGLSALSSLFEDIGRSAVTSAQATVRALRQVIGALIKEGVAAAVANSLKSASGLLGPLAVPIAGAAGAAANALFQRLLSGVGVPALADGGITLGPQLALIGEAGPEAVIPLNKLENFVGGGGGDGYVAEARISGEDLLLLISRAERRAQRITG